MFQPFNSSLFHAPILTPNTVRKQAVITQALTGPISLPISSSSAIAISTPSMAQPVPISVSISSLPGKATPQSQSSQPPASSPQPPLKNLETASGSTAASSQSSISSPATTSNGAVSQYGGIYATTISSFSISFSAITASVDSSSSATATPSTSAASDSSSQTLSHPALISISVVSGVVALLFISLLFFVLRRRYRQIQLNTNSDPDVPLVGPPFSSGPPSPMPPGTSAKTSNNETANSSGSPFGAPRARPIPSPIPIFSPYHDEKEVFTPLPPQSALLSPRRPTHPLFSPAPFSPLPTSPATMRAASIRRSQSWAYDVTPPKVPSPPPLVSPMYSPSYPVTNAKVSGHHFPPPSSMLLPISSLAGRSELDSPGPTATFGDVRWGSRRNSGPIQAALFSKRNSRGGSRTHSPGLSPGPSSRRTSLTAQIPEMPGNQAPTAVGPTEMSANRNTQPGLDHQHSIPEHGEAMHETSRAGYDRDYEANEPVELPTSKATPRGSRWTTATSKTNSTGVDWLKRSGTVQSESARSAASSRYSQASSTGGGRVGDRIVADMPALEDSSELGENEKGGESVGRENAATTTSTAASANVHTNPAVAERTTRERQVEVTSGYTDTGSIQSILDLLRSERQSKA